MRIVAGLNPQTGVVSRDLQAIDATSGQPPADPLNGFLVPDRIPPAGEGGAAFTVWAHAGLTTGAKITNRATIIFDHNPPIGTPTWLNTIDRSPPTSHVTRVKPGSATARQRRHGRLLRARRVHVLKVAWSGRDCTPVRGRGQRRVRRRGRRALRRKDSGVAGFDVYISSGGRFIAALFQTPATHATFVCAPGHRYRFRTVAHDAAGNVQAARPRPSPPVRCR